MAHLPPHLRLGPTHVYGARLNLHPLFIVHPSVLKAEKTARGQPLAFGIFQKFPVVHMKIYKKNYFQWFVFCIQLVSLQ